LALPKKYFGLAGGSPSKAGKTGVSRGASAFEQRALFERWREMRVHPPVLRKARSPPYVLRVATAILLSRRRAARLPSTCGAFGPGRKSDALSAPPCRRLRARSPPTSGRRRGRKKLKPSVRRLGGRCARSRRHPCAWDRPAQRARSSTGKMPALGGRCVRIRRYSPRARTPRGWGPER
jgi:hypothetical protein